MIDIHSHILPAVDDGANTITEALKIAKEAEEQGVNHVIATPHYVDPNDALTADVINKKVVSLQEELDDSDIDINILPGAEVYINPKLGQEVEKGRVCSLNNSRYILLELPFKKLPSFVNNVIYDLKVLGYTPVISHPERYTYISSDPNILYNLVKEGVYAQMNAGSLMGRYGSRVKETAKTLLKNRLIHLIGSDVHSSEGRTVCLKQGMTEIKKEIGQERVNYFKENARAVIDDEKLTKLIPAIQKNKTFFSKLKSIISFG